MQWRQPAEASGHQWGVEAAFLVREMPRSEHLAVVVFLALLITWVEQEVEAVSARILLYIEVMAEDQVKSDRDSPCACFLLTSLGAVTSPVRSALKNGKVLWSTRQLQACFIEEIFPARNVVHG